MFFYLKFIFFSKSVLNLDLFFLNIIFYKKCIEFRTIEQSINIFLHYFYKKLEPLNKFFIFIIFYALFLLKRFLLLDKVAVICSL